jgi:putative flippase GtrA
MLIRRAWRFSVTGIATTGVHMIVAIAIIEIISPSQSLANGVAFLLATAFSYFVNTLWSFSARLHGKNLTRYLVTAFVGFCVAIVVSSLAQSAGWNYLIGILLVSCAVPPVNFAMHNFWTYR